MQGYALLWFQEPVQIISNNKCDVFYGLHVILVDILSFLESEFQENFTHVRTLLQQSSFIYH